MCAAAAFTHHQCIFGSFTPFPVGGTLPLDAVLQNPGMDLDLLERDSLFRVQDKKLQMCQSKYLQTRWQATMVHTYLLDEIGSLRTNE